MDKEALAKRKLELAAIIIAGICVIISIVASLYAAYSLGIFRFGSPQEVCIPELPCLTADEMDSSRMQIILFGLLGISVTLLTYAYAAIATYRSHKIGYVITAMIVGLLVYLIVQFF